MNMLRVKYWLKKEDVRNFFIILGISIVYLIFFHQSTEIVRVLSDLFFMMGVLHFVLGGIRYISNVGLFKTFSYTAYKNRWKKHGPEDGELRPMTLAEYTQKVIWDELRQKPVLRVFLTGVAMWAISILLVFVYN